jgi:uncharacterized membrane protein YeaQ/YmgE (transglycosylase-associated protein family)
MIGMHFGSFLVVLIAALIAAFVLHYLARYRYLKGFDGFLAQWVVGWFGARLGSPVLGHWWFKIRDIYAIPALLGAFVAVFIVTAAWKACALVCVPKPS